MARRARGLGEMIECTTVQRWGCSKLRPRVPSAATCQPAQGRECSPAVTPLCGICLLQPFRGSEQVFLARCHLGTLPSPITTLGFCAEKGGWIMAWLGKATHDHWGAWLAV